MSRQDQHTASGKATYRKVVVAGALLAVVALVAGVAAARARRHAVPIDPMPSAAVSTESVATEPATGGEDSTTVTATDVAAVPVDAPARSARTVEPAPPSKALAAAVTTSGRSAECGTVLGANADPTNGEISGTRGLPDQVAYFRSRAHVAPCTPVARAVSESP